MVVPFSTEAKLLEPGGSLKIKSGVSGAAVTNVLPPDDLPPLIIPSDLKISLFSILIGFCPSIKYSIEMFFLKPSDFEMFGIPAANEYVY